MSWLFFIINRKKVFFLSSFDDNLILRKTIGTLEKKLTLFGVKLSHFAAFCRKIASDFGKIAKQTATFLRLSLTDKLQSKF